jgi:hypothetical protein
MRSWVLRMGSRKAAAPQASRLGARIITYRLLFAFGSEPERASTGGARWTIGMPFGMGLQNMSMEMFRCAASMRRHSSGPGSLITPSLGLRQGAHSGGGGGDALGSACARRLAPSSDHSTSPWIVAPVLRWHIPGPRRTASPAQACVTTRLYKARGNGQAAGAKAQGRGPAAARPFAATMIRWARTILDGAWEEAS